MWRRRNHYVNVALDGMTTLLNAGGAALVSMYDTGARLARKARRKMKHSEKAELERTIRESEMTILGLKYKIGKEMVRLKWYRLLRQTVK
ncbi:MAG TPA: hypothetical protein HPP76_08920 [Desulfuromonadales bacterium]|nr:hypothetical protein [Desulfuromonadales bacterium]